MCYEIQSKIWFELFNCIMQLLCSTIYFYAIHVPIDKHITADDNDAVKEWRESDSATCTLTSLPFHNVVVLFRTVTVYLSKVAVIFTLGGLLFTIVSVLFNIAAVLFRTVVGNNFLGQVLVITAQLNFRHCKIFVMPEVFICCNKTTLVRC